MESVASLSDNELKTQIASILGWYEIHVDFRGNLIGRLPNVRSLVPLVIPDWTGSQNYAEALEEAICHKGLRDQYMLNLATLGGDRSNEGILRFLVDASPRQRCEAALMTLSEV